MGRPIWEVLAEVEPQVVVLRPWPLVPTAPGDEDNTYLMGWLRVDAIVATEGPWHDWGFRLRDATLRGGCATSMDVHVNMDGYVLDGDWGKRVFNVYDTCVHTFGVVDGRPGWSSSRWKERAGRVYVLPPSTRWWGAVFPT